MKRNILKIGKWAVLAIVMLCAGMVIVGAMHLSMTEKAQQAVAKISATRLSLSDVTGEDLPPDPSNEKDMTLQGVDANKNGIRDDVELAIFKQYPDSAKTRAALLQYALVLQMATLYPLGEETATAIAEQDSRAYDCIGTIVPRDTGDIQKIEAYRAFVENTQLTTTERKNTQQSFEEETRSFQLQSGCDIDPTLFPNL